MQILDFFSIDFFMNVLLVPIIVLVISLFIGDVLNSRLKTILAEEKVPASSLLGLILKSLKGLPRLLAFVIGLYLVINSLPMPEGVRHPLSNLLFTLIIYFFVTVVSRAMNELIELRMSKDGSPVSTSLLTNLVSALIYAVGVIIVLDFYGISIAPIITALGVGGMAVALGLQETMANIFAGIHLLLSKQVRIGDHVRLDSGAEGEVADITWRYAKLHTVSNNVVVVPNSKLLSSVTTNYDMPIDSTSSSVRVEDVFFTLAVGVSYDSDLDKVEKITLEVARGVLAKFDPTLDISEGSSTAPAVRFHTFGDSSIDFNINLHTSEYKKQYLIKHEVIKALKRRYDAEGIEIPFPVRTFISKDKG